MSQTTAQLIDNLVQPLTGADGTEGAPTFSFTDDTNTGIYSPGADQVAISTGGSGRLFIDASGNVGIGGTPNAQLNLIASVPILRLTDSDTSGYSQVLQSDTSLYIDADRGAAGTGALILRTNGTNERLRIDSSGRLLVGISTAPSVQQVQAANTGGENLGAFRFSDNTGASDIAFHKSRGSLGNHSLVSNDDAIGSLAFRASDGSAYRNAASVNAFVDGTAADSDMPGRLVFSTNPGGTALTERMRIDSSGDVEIMQGKNLTWVYEGGSTHRARIRAESTDALIFENGSGNDERMRIDSSGNVGINSSSPDSFGKFVVRNGDNRYTAIASNGYLTARYDDNSATIFPITIRNTGMTAVGHGAYLRFYLGRGTTARNGGLIGSISESAYDSDANADASLVFQTAQNNGHTERMRITSDGYVRLNSGASGIQFNNDTADTNALNDYEEGTWEPTFQGESNNNNPTITYSSRKARYTKIGRLVSLQGYIQTSAVSGTGTTYLQIGNLPFTVGIGSDTDYTSSLVVGNAGNYNNSHPNGGYLRESQNGIYLTRHGGTSWELIETNHLQNTSFIHFAIDYITSQ